jgi:hypothetical protein
MNTLTFSLYGLKALLADAEKQWPEGTRGYLKESDDPCFWLVGDHGVYLMHNGKQHDKILYANECDPNIMPFDAWWQAKRDTFGGDDGVVEIEIKTIKAIIDAESDLTVTFTPESVELTYTKAS